MPLAAPANFSGIITTTDATIVIPEPQGIVYLVRLMTLYNANATTSTCMAYTRVRSIDES